ncbi:MAG TPA: hypothetical protein VIY48_22240, partial [Candidatus Paceibacterota bacterium]
TITSETRILIDDTGKTLSNYSLKHDDYVARAEGKSVAEIQKMVEDALAASDLVGCKIELLSSVYYQTPYVKPKKVVNPKHKASMFVLDTTRHHFVSPYSDNWTAITRVPESTDVYVVIHAFQAYSNFSNEIKEDRAALEAFGETMPPIYGYKDTEKKPAKGMEGLEYRVWRETFMKSLLTPARIQLIQNYYWQNPEKNVSNPGKVEIAKLCVALGDTHPISVALSKMGGTQLSSYIGRFAERVGIYRRDSDAEKCWTGILKDYPLLAAEGMRCLWYTWNGANPSDWIDYVQLVDFRAAAITAAQAAAQPLTPAPVVLTMVP